MECVHSVIFIFLFLFLDLCVSNKSKDPDVTVGYKGLSILLFISHVCWKEDLCILKFFRLERVTDKHSFGIFMYFPVFDKAPLGFG